MRTSRRQFLACCGASGVSLGLYPGTALAASADALAIVVAQSSSLARLTRFELEKLYLGTALLNPAGERIVPINQPPQSPTRIAFDQHVLNMTSEQNAKYWIDRRIRGQGNAPKSVGPADLLQRVVSKLAHSVAYVRWSEVRPDVRVIAIDGKLPADPAYGLVAAELGPVR